LENINFIQNSDNSITVKYEKNSDKFEKLLDLFKKNELKILDISTVDGDLEDVFIKLTKN
jgi:ABC-2 type transport system ATP-binding protein